MEPWLEEAGALGGVDTGKLAGLALRLLHNLSFDEAGRTEMASAGAIPQALALLRSPAHRTGALGLLYHLSLERSHRPLFLAAPAAATAALPSLLLAAGDLRTAPELAALAVNLSMDNQLAADMAGGGALAALLGKALAARDPLALRITRNLAERCATADAVVAFAPAADALADLLTDPTTDADVRVEALGLLAHAALPPLRWRPILARSGLPAWLVAALVPGGAADDIALEAVMAGGALCTTDTAPLLAQAGLGTALVALLAERRADDECALRHAAM
ncbi:hypothetical protein WJX81_000668 [Elliptochloris bilobata]|uniref:Uncharacterized protein n=1 Tax=Elliptochloris bilobata TaxID=381761 RepID=A0AAW1QDV7_9CHLO